MSVTSPTVFLIRVLFDAILQARTWDESARQFSPLISLTLIVEPSLDRIRSVTTSTTLRANYHLYSRGNAIVCVCLRMQCYFITQAVDILYGTLRARGLADYGTEGVSILQIGEFRKTYRTAIGVNLSITQYCPTPLPVSSDQSV